MNTLRHLLAALLLALVTLTGAPVMAADINDLNVTDASNTARFPEGMAPSAVNDGARALEGIVARWHKDTNASIAAGGTANAITVTANQVLSAYFDGLEIAFNATAANTGNTTLSVDAIGAKKVLKNGTSELAPGDIVLGQKVIVIYDSDGDGGSGSWQMMSPASTTPLADNSVTTSKIADGAVTSAKLATETAPIVGEVRSYIGTTAPAGWLFLNGDTFGSAASTATQQSDSFQSLFELLWNSMPDAQAPVVGGRGVSANADWLADKAITLPDPRGRAIISTDTTSGGPTRAHGSTGGSRDAIVVTHSHGDTFSTSSNGSHNHNARTTNSPDSDFDDVGNVNVLSRAASNTIWGSNGGTLANATDPFTNSNGSHSHTVNGSVSNAGSSGTDANMQPFLALNMIIKF